MRERIDEIDRIIKGFMIQSKKEKEARKKRVIKS